VPYRTTKLPTYVFDSVELAKAKILTERSKLNELPLELRKPEKCPICHGHMSGFEVRTRVSYYQCEECGYKQPGLEIQAQGTDVASLAAALGLGALAGLGIAALLYLLTQGGSEGDQRS